MIDGDGVESVNENVVPGNFPRTRINVSEMTDKELVEMFCRGHKEITFAEIYRRYCHQVWNRVRRAFERLEDAEDVMQDIFQKGYKSLSQYRGECNLSTWLSCIEKNSIISRYRYVNAKGRYLSIQPDDDYDPQSPHFYQPDTIAINKETLTIAKECISQLSALLRIVFEKRVFEGKKEKDVSQDLGVPEGTVKSRFNAARHQILTCMKKKMGGVD